MSEITLTNELTAWGETKTIAEWARDERATADAKIIAKRYESGSEPEKAIAFKPGVFKKAVRATRENEHFAFGKLKSLAEWSRSTECCVSLPTLRKRMSLGWSFEKALSTPAQATYGSNARPRRPIEAWGETKSIFAWAADARCSVSRTEVTKRLNAGWDAERAISQPWLNRNQFAEVEAFGETKSALQWVRDPRCTVSVNCLTDRLSKGIDAERAISTPPTHRAGATGRKHGSHKLHELYGRKMTLGQWGREPECAVSEATLRVRMANGWKLEAALLTPIQNPTRIVAKKKREFEYVEYTAFGETKPLYDWYKDPRCKVRRHTVWARIKKGYSMEDALRTRLFGLRESQVLPRYRALGSIKTLREWSHDPRCQVTLRDLQRRLNKGYTIEAALTTPPLAFDVMSAAKGQKVTAFGETKTPGQWARDSRCMVSSETLCVRIGHGLAPELAITSPAGDVNRVDGSTRLMGQQLTAFGETKRFRDWIVDSRCLVTKDQLKDRLRKGWEFDRALTTPKMSAAESMMACQKARVKLITAFGETKSLADWARDPRAAVCRDAINTRLRKGVAPEEAITAKRTWHRAKGKAAA